VIRYLAKRFNLPAITGKTTQAARVKALKTFERDGALLITEKSAGVGLCLQRAHHLVFVENNMKNKEQVIGRIKRIGQTHPIKLWTLVCKHTANHQSLRI
jgi:SNF2 family DNA or RNA helicase